MTTPSSPCSFCGSAPTRSRRLVGDRHAADVAEDVRQDGNAALEEDAVGGRRRGAVRTLDDALRPYAVRVVGADLVFEGGRDEDVALEREEVLVRDRFGVCEALHEAGLVAEDERSVHIDTIRIVPSAGDVADGDDRHTGLSEELGRRRAHVGRGA